jgi:hypothetical protein
MPQYSIERADSARPADYAQMQADRHHLRLVCAFRAANRTVGDVLGKSQAPNATPRDVERLQRWAHFLGEGPFRAAERPIQRSSAVGLCPDASASTFPCRDD